MPLQYVVPVSLTVIGDGKSNYIAIDLAKDYMIMGEHLKHGWLTGKLPVSVSTDATNPIGAEAALRKGSTVIFVTFPTAPSKGSRIPVHLHLHFDGEDREEPKPEEAASDLNQGKQGIASDIQGQ